MRHEGNRKPRAHTGSHAHSAGASTRFVLIFDIWHPDFSPDEVRMQQRSQFNRPLPHVTSECHMSRTNVTCHQHMSHVTCTCHMSHGLTRCASSTLCTRLASGAIVAVINRIRLNCMHRAERRAAAAGDDDDSFYSVLEKSRSPDLCLHHCRLACSLVCI